MCVGLEEFCHIRFFVTYSFPNSYIGSFVLSKRVGVCFPG